MVDFPLPDDGEMLVTDQDVANKLNSGTAVADDSAVSAPSAAGDRKAGSHQHSQNRPDMKSGLRNNFDRYIINNLLFLSF